MNKFYLDRDIFASGLLIGIIVTVVLFMFCSITGTPRHTPFTMAVLTSFMIVIYYAFFEKNSDEIREKFGKYFVAFGFLTLMLGAIYLDLTKSA